MRRRLLLLCLVLCFPLICVAAEEEVEEPPKLLGICSLEQLDEEPFSEWYRKGYDEYRPNSEFLQSLRAADLNGVELQLFFGSWCGDSKREVPRILKLLAEIGFPQEQVKIIGVDSGEGVHKRSPSGEEKGLEIYRVPTLVVNRGGNEIARLVEFPVLSLERDLTAILTGANYEPNYRSYPTLRRWLQEGLLSDENVSSHGLAQQIRGLVSGEGEIAAASSVLLERGDTAEAVKLAEINCALHRDSARAYARLAKTRLRAGMAEEAHEAAKRALRLNEESANVADLLDLLEQTRVESPTIAEK